jgi:hypothetical protein
VKVLTCGSFPFCLGSESSQKVDEPQEDVEEEKKKATG